MTLSAWSFFHFSLLHSIFSLLCSCLPSIGGENVADNNLLFCRRRRCLALYCLGHVPYLCVYVYHYYKEQYYLPTVNCLSGNECALMQEKADNINQGLFDWAIAQKNVLFFCLNLINREFALENETICNFAKFSPLQSSSTSFYAIQFDRFIVLYSF